MEKKRSQERNHLTYYLDVIDVETDKVIGKVKLTQLIHPRVVAVTGLGSWARGTPLARGKGVNPNQLLRIDQDYTCPITGTLEITARAKAYKTEASK